MNKAGFAAIVLLWAFSGTASLFAQGVLSRQNLETVPTTTCESMNGMFECEYKLSRTDQFMNPSADSLVTLAGLNVVVLDPEDVGFANLEVQNVAGAVGAAKSVHPDVNYWGGWFINTRDPARAVWSDAVTEVSGPNGEDVFPIVLGAGQALELTSVTSLSAQFETEPEFVEGEFLMGWTLDESVGPVVPLRAGDADQDFDFDQLDLVKVQQGGKYLSAQSATWGEGDWNGAPGGFISNPPAGDGFFNQVDIVAALSAGLYLTGPYAAIGLHGQEGDGQTSIIYDPNSGELKVDAPANQELTSINIDSAAGIFTGDPAQNLGSSFDNDSDDNIFKATFGSSFGSISFGNVAPSGLSEEYVSNDLTVVGSRAGGGDLGNVDLIYVPEPSTLALVLMGIIVWLGPGRRGNESVR